MGVMPNVSPSVGNIQHMLSQTQPHVKDNDKEFSNPLRCKDDAPLETNHDEKIRKDSLPHKLPDIVRKEAQMVDIMDIKTLEGRSGREMDRSDTTS